MLDVVGVGGSDIAGSGDIGAALGQAGDGLQGGDFALAQ